MGQGHDTGPDALTPPLAIFELFVLQVPSFSTMRAYQPKGGHQAGRLHGLLRACPALEWLRSLRLSRRHPAINPSKLAHADVTASQRLLVVLHTARPRVGALRTAMPSPSAKLKAARRLPKHLKVSGRPPSGAIAQARAEAEARFLRGESCRAGQHSSLYKVVILRRRRAAIARGRRRSSRALQAAQHLASEARGHGCKHGAQD